MTPDRWRQVNDLFHDALALPAADRAALLDRTAAADPELASEVRSLLTAHDSSTTFLEQPVWAVAPALALGDDAPLPPGTPLGPYRLIREIGRGGMGVVYEAEDTRLGRRVALKALPGAYRNDPLRRERLAREARAAAALSHPAIATVYALEELDGELYLVSELVRGRTLREELREGALPPERLWPTLRQLAGGLAAAHAAGIVHRDFKPENVVRCDDGRLKIVDFGLATLPVTGTRLTQTGLAVGTPGYMPPEQVRGDEAGPPADVFAFGVVAWELATGAHPVAGGAADLLDRPRGTNAFDSASDLRQRAPALEPLVRRCLRREPAERYASAGVVLAELDRITAAGVTVPLATPSGISPAALWWWQFHQAVLALVIAAMPVTAWFLRAWDRRIGGRLFLAVLALATIAVTIRLNLLFTSRVNAAHLRAQRARVHGLLLAAEGVLGAVLLVAAALVADTHEALASVLVTFAVATVASIVVIEPATTAGAGLGRDAT